MMHQVSEKNGKVKVIPLSELTSDCWMVQFWGLPACRTCDAWQTPECGGQDIRESIFIGNGRVGIDGLPDASIA